MARSKRKPTKGNASTNHDALKEKENQVTKSDERPESVEATKDTSPIGSKQTNDPEWYARDPRLAIDGASIPFNVPFGSHVDYIDNVMVTLPSGTTFSNDYVNPSVPGICSLKLKPSFGTNNTKTDPVNVCANALYTHVRYMNSGRKNYDPADLFLYAAAFGDIYSFVMWCERMYAYAFMYSQRNWYIGRYMIEANGVDADNLIQNLANFRYWINSIINKVSSFCIPADIYYFKRRAFLYANYYIENPYGNMKDQMYQFVPEGFYCFDLSGANSAGALRYRKISDIVQKAGAKLVYTDFATIFNAMMQNITGDEDFGLMSGDILKAYGIDHLVGLPQLGEDAGLMPVYDPYVLSQFKNANIAYELYRSDPSKYFNIEGETQNYIYGDIDQSTNGLLISRESADFTLTTPALLATMNKPITVENPDPGIGDVLEATRLMLGYDSEIGTYESGTEIVVGCVLSWIGQGLTGLLSVDSTYGNFHYTNDEKATTTSYEILHSSFKYAPWLMYVNKDKTVISGMRMDCNTDNLTIATNEMLSRVHEIALLSLFYVPGVAKLVN